MLVCDICGAKINTDVDPVTLWAYVGKSTTPHTRVDVDMCLKCRNELYERKRKVEADFYAERVRNG